MTTAQAEARSLLKAQIQTYGPGGQARAARELDYSEAALNLYLNDKYGASAARIESTIIRVYGEGGTVICEHLGCITVAACSSTFHKAKTIGMRAGNPDTLRLYSACLNCSLRSRKEAS